MTTISVRMTKPSGLHAGAGLIGPSVFTRIGRWLQQAWCVVNGGHFKVLHTEPSRMALRCVACGHTSPGWSVGSPRLVRTVPADRERLRLRRPHAA